MKILKYLIFGIIIYLLIGCDDASARGESTLYVSPTRTYIENIYVNKRTGFDGDRKLGYGNVTNPFKTISYALKNNFIEDTFGRKVTVPSIYIAGGNYTKEIFPINLQKNINLFSYNDESNLSVEIKNNNETTIILNGDNRLSNLIVSSQKGTAILSKEGNNSLNFITIKNSKNGISVLNSSSLVIKNSIIKDNSHSGVELSNNSSIKLINSEINNSNIGIFISDNATIDINSKNNKIKENRQCDFFTNGYNDIKLQGIEWDKNIFDFNIETSCIDGNNIVNVGEGVVSYQTLPNEENITVIEQLFLNAKNRINIISPKFEEAISTVTPTIKYSNNLDNKYLMVTIFNKIPKVIDNEIINSNDIFWYWHTGMRMNNSSMGIIDYTDGQNLIDGEINNEKRIDVLPLDKGRSYYLAIWEWDSENAIDIVSSSSVSIFYIYP